MNARVPAWLARDIGLTNKDLIDDNLHRDPLFFADDLDRRGGAPATAVGLLSEAALAEVPAEDTAGTSVGASDSAGAFVEESAGAIGHAGAFVEESAGAIGHAGAFVEERAFIEEEGAIELAIDYAGAFSEERASVGNIELPIDYAGAFSEETASVVGNVENASSVLER